ncbi:ABC transporter permease subunit [Desulfosporosinus sp. FKA]|uniref:ABC transporter permease subunit n=1 Tax=Desulfosporosinus sp. FKA TaxID=1969834 RepID=UPI000B497315|nr:ABC transporter permease subunit [Desulfosporosinus sp. FKA]
MKALWTLVRNDSKIFDKVYYRESSPLMGIYQGLANALVMGGLIWATSLGFINGGFVIWCVLISIPFVISFSILNKEWHDGTIGWWLALPYPRSLLLSAKCIASFLLLLESYIFILAIVLIQLFLINSTLPPFLPHTQLLDAFQACSEDLSWLLIISPFSILLGTLIISFARSHWLPKFPIAWGGLGFGFIVNLYVVKVFGLLPLSTSSVHHGQMHFISVNGSNFLTTLLFSLSISAILFAFSVYILTQHVEV